MSTATLDAVFRANGLHEHVMAEIRKDISFNEPYNASFTKLINELKKDHSLEEVDHYDALWSLFFIFLTMSTGTTKRDMMELLTTHKLEHLQLKLAESFQYELRDMQFDKLLPSAHSYMSLMS